jgi:putative tricarboxylic transport membrane protein
MAIFLGGLALLNLSPGPNMVRQQLAITYTIVWSLALATIIGAAICILLSNQIAKITKIRFAIMAPLLFMMIAFAAFESRQSLGDLAALIAIGFLGILLRRFDYSRPAFLIGFVLSSQVENFANMANQIAAARFHRSFAEGLSYIATPLSLSILALTVMSIFVGLRHAKHITENEATASGSKRASVIFLLCITAYVAASLIDASTITRVSDKIFPLTVATVTLIACIALLIRMRRAPETDPIFVDLEVGGADAQSPHGLWPTLFWFALLLALSWLFGFIIALTIFFLAFYRVRAGLNWAGTLIYSAAGVAAMIAFGWLLGRDFPPGLLQGFIQLPWPFT